jgi:hypothetical protein
VLRNGALAAAAAAALALASARAAAQEIITYTEITRSGREIPIEASTRAVDVNSAVRLKIDLDAMRREIGTRGTLPDSLLGEIATITATLEGVNAFLDALGQAKAAYAAEPTEANRGRLLDAYAAIGPRARTLLEAPEGSGLQVRMAQALAGVRGASVPERYAAYFRAAADHVDALQKEVEAHARTSGVQVRLGAWLNGVPVHLPGFDTVAVQEEQVVPSFQLFLTPEQTAEINRLAAEAKELRRKTSAQPFPSPGPLVTRFLSEDLQCVTSLRDRLRGLASGGTPIPSAGPAATAAQSLLDLTASLKERYLVPGGPGGEALLSAGADLGRLFDASSTLVARLETLSTALSGAATDAQRGAREAGAACLADIRTRLVERLAPVLEGTTIRAGQRLATESIEFSDAVLRLSIDQVPAGTELALVTAGPREPGDQLGFRMSAVEPGGRERMLASRTYTVQRAEPHVHLSVAMIWAHRDPDEAGAEDGKNWHPAPGYSILLKRFLGGGGITRKHPMYGEVLNPGIGLNLSAPDFDLDDTPEFAVGAVISVFRDYIQGGVSYNLQQQKWFPFIGIRLPLPSATLPAVAGEDNGG